jgi:uncharacterized membrane protein
MTPLVTVEIRTHIAAPPDAVWARLTDHEGMPGWLKGLHGVTLEPPGKPERNGIGAIRVLRAPGLRLREQVVAWSPPRHYEYKVLDGAPLRDHLGRVEVQPAAQGTDVVWRIRFHPAVRGTGWLLRLLLHRLIGSGLGRLRSQLEAAARA